MHNLQIQDRKISIDFPSNIDELSIGENGQFAMYCRLILQYISGSISVDQFKALFFIELVDIKKSWRYYFFSSEKKEVITCELLRLSQVIDSFFEEYEKEGKPVKAFQLNTVKNFIPRVCRWYYGPQDGFKDMTFCEYRSAFTWFKAYSDTNQESDLDQLIAILYRPRKKFLWIRKYLPGYNGQERVSFTSKSNPELIQFRLKRIVRLPLHVKYAIFLYFSGCEDYLRSGSPTIDGNKIDLSIIYKQPKDEQQASELKDIGILGILYSLSESRVFGSIEETDSQMLWDVMIRLYQVVKQNKDIESRYGSRT
ncbi:MAG: hypothetical protein NTU51_10580 [Bacteroidetes bacterium]|nr:hypothetical protein [Bacteroidota bacterium]